VKITESIKINWLKIVRYSLVLFIPMILILGSSFFGLAIETYLFVAVGISNLIALVDINSELCEKIEGPLFIQLILLAFIIAFSFSLIFVDYGVKPNNYLFFGIGLVLLILSSFFMLKKNMRIGNYLLFLGIVVFSIFLWININENGSHTYGAPIHLILLPLFFCGFDAYRFKVLKVSELKELMKLDFGLVVVGILIFLTACVSEKPLQYFEAGAAATIMIIGNYCYLLLPPSKLQHT